MGRVTIQDLASSLQLTKSTVSRALNDYPDISITTKKRVARQALKLGYRPSKQAQGLRTGQTRSVGLILNMDSDNTHKPFLSSFLDGISRFLSEQGWSLTVATAVDPSDSVDKHRSLYIDRKVDGFILPRTAANDARVNALREADIPFVMYGRHLDDRQCAWFDIAGEDAMSDAVERLANFGHSRIAYIGGGRLTNFEVLRQQGYRDGMKKQSLAIDDDLIRSNAMTERHGFEAALSLLKLSRPPTAIVCALDRVALGAYSAIEKNGLAVGKNISIIAYDGTPEGRYATPPLTTFSVDNQKAGRSLAELLLRRVNGEDAKSLRVLSHALLISRKSDGPIHHSTKQLAELIIKNSNNTTQKKILIEPEEPWLN